MSEKNNNTTMIVAGTAIVTGAIGLAFTGPQQSAEIGANNVANLPALQKAIENLDEDTDRRFQEFQEQLDRRLDKEIKPRIDEVAAQARARNNEQWS